MSVTIHSSVTNWLVYAYCSGGNNSEPEEGEVNESGSEKSGNESDSDAGSDKSEEFNDGYDENLMGDDEDRRRSLPWDEYVCGVQCSWSAYLMNVM